MFKGYTESLAAKFCWIFFNLAGNKGAHKSLDEFKFRPDSATDYGIS